ncbi:venom protease-like [Pseudoliparis swirei]|uniref:venom protease-like n=1 Tax=Pseudoliparis swirei TaxID=2059687 RepID=UPI0024BE17A5|nr:venom protease-like [Pseudoliparis swirei]
MLILLASGCHSQQPALSVCGRAVRNSRIVGGRNASPGSWPWLVSLNHDDRPFCAGSLIHNQWVLTAAHCLTGFKLLTTTVYLGRLSQSSPNINEVSRGLERIVCHPSYDFLTHENDICLLKLSTPVEFTDYIQPVCLASTGSTFHSGVSSWVTGFGLTQYGKITDYASTGSDILQEVNLPIVGNKVCRCTYPGITENMICAGFNEGGKDACQGDSGGPLVTQNGFTWIQSGVVSFGHGCARPMTPGGYTRVSQYQDWITNITDSNAPGFVAYTSSGVDSDFNINCSNIPPTSATINTTTPRPATPTTRTTTVIPTTTAMTTTPSIPTTTPTTTTETPTTPTTCTTPSTTKPPTIQTIPMITTALINEHKSINSIFDSGVHVIHFSYFTSLCLLLVSLFMLVGGT